MAGIVNDNLIYPILDLIQREIRVALANQQLNNGGSYSDPDYTPVEISTDPFAGIPSVVLERNHPNDSSKTILTKVTMTYSSFYRIEIGLEYGVNSLNTSFAWALTKVIVSALDPFNTLVVKYEISLSYSQDNILQSTSVQRVAGTTDPHF